MRFSSIITSSAIAVIGWMIFVTAFANYVKLNSTGPPRVNIGNLQTSLTPKEKKQPLEQVAKERGWDLKLPFVSDSEAEEIIVTHATNKLFSLLIAFLAGSILYY